MPLPYTRVQLTQVGPISMPPALPDDHVGEFLYSWFVTGHLSIPPDGPATWDTEELLPLFGGHDALLDATLREAKAVLAEGWFKNEWRVLSWWRREELRKASEEQKQRRPAGRPRLKNDPDALAEAEQIRELKAKGVKLEDIPGHLHLSRKQVNARDKLLP